MGLEANSTARVQVSSRRRARLSPPSGPPSCRPLSATTPLRSTCWRTRPRAQRVRAQRRRRRALSLSPSKPSLTRCRCARRGCTSLHDECVRVVCCEPYTPCKGNPVGECSPAALWCAAAVRRLWPVRMQALNAMSRDHGVVPTIRPPSADSRASDWTDCDQEEFAHMMARIPLPRAENLYCGACACACAT